MQAKSRKGAAKEIRTVDRKRLNSKIQKNFCRGVLSYSEIYIGKDSL
jgi:hypothetical protein